MERNSQNSQGYKLESQIREAYGRVLYSQTSHDKKAQCLLKQDQWIKISQIALSAITTGGFLKVFLCDGFWDKIIGGFSSMVLMLINAYTLRFSLSEDAQRHIQAANELWKIREEYVSLITDFELLESETIISKRDELQSRTYQVYCNSPRTDADSYEKARKALKDNEEQTFSDDEIDIMLPNSIRRKNREISQM